jgi:hypothetical protein
MTKQYRLPTRYEGRKDVPYVMRGRKLSEMEPLADAICEGLAKGRSLKSVCSAPGMPALRSIFQWLREDSAFRDAYDRAREQQARAFADELSELADQASGLDAAGVNAMRLRVDTRKWIVSKMLPKEYGDRVDVLHAGGISVSAVSKALATVKPITFDAEGYELDDDGARVASASTERATDGDESDEHKAASSVPLMGPPAVSKNHATPLPPPPGKGTPITVTTPVSSQPRFSEIPAEDSQDSDGISTLSDLL